MASVNVTRTPESVSDYADRTLPVQAPTVSRVGDSTWGARAWGIGATVVVHVAAAALLLRMEVSREPIVPAQAVMVDLIEPPKPPQPVVEPPKPKPVVNRPVPQPKQPVRASDPVPVPTPAVPTSADPVVASSTPSPVAREVPVPMGPTSPQPVAAAPPPKPVAILEPRFDAAYLNNPAPLYPSVSRRLGEQGRVLLRVQVDERGTPTNVTLGASSGHERLDNVALETVRRWKFVPARRGEEAVSAWVIVPIVFNLRS